MMPARAGPVIVSRMEAAFGDAPESKLKAPRAAGVAGLVFAALFVVALLLVRRHPAADSTAQEVALWYLGPNRTNVGLVGIYIVPFAGIAFLWFTAVIRASVVELRDRFLDTTLLGSALIFIAMLWAAAGSGGALLAAVKFLDAPIPTPDAVGVARALSYTFFYVYALRAAAVFVMVTSLVGLRSGGLPRWLAFAGFVLAVVLLVGVSYISLVALLFPAWVVAVSIVMLRRAPGRGAAEPEPAASG
jgi:hypothetical protein